MEKEKIMAEMLAEKLARLNNEELKRIYWLIKGMTLHTEIRKGE